VFVNVVVHFVNSAADFVNVAVDFVNVAVGFGDENCVIGKDLLSRIRDEEKMRNKFHFRLYGCLIEKRGNVKVSPPKISSIEAERHLKCSEVNSPSASQITFIIIFGKHIIRTFGGAVYGITHSAKSVG